MFFMKRLKKNESPELSKPSELDLLFSSFPRDLQDDVAAVIEVLKDRKDWTNFFCNDRFRAHYKQIELIIPWRFYAKKVTDDQIVKLSMNQKIILYCIFTRSTNGYIRQEYVEKLLQLEDTPVWVFPFIVKLGGGYVIEILHSINEHFGNVGSDKFEEFINENKAFVHLEYCHMVSYWDCNYRYNGFPKLHGFIGYELFKRSFKYSRSFERPYLDSLRQKALKQITKLELFKQNTELDQNYFLMTLNEFQLGTEQLGLVRSNHDAEFTRVSDGSRWRERLLYNTRYGQSMGYERLPALDFDRLIYTALSYNIGVSTLSEAERKQNALGSVAVIMEDHLDEFVDFLTKHVDNEDLFGNDIYRENLKLFCIDETESKGLGGLGKFTYEDYLNTRIKWHSISKRIKNKIYQH